jgi:hypothetical protein
VSYAAIKRRQRKELYPVEFKPVNWEPQVEVTFTQDVTGWLDHDKRVRFHFQAGKSYHVDEQHAVEFIVKGYATGTLPRQVSENERADIRSVMTTIGLGQSR